jgi:hypothetical protein
MTIAAITPAFLYLAAWFALTGIVYLAFAFETRGRTFEAIDAELAATRQARSRRSRAAGAAG